MIAIYKKTFNFFFKKVRSQTELLHFMKYQENSEKNSTQPDDKSEDSIEVEQQKKQFTICARKTTTV